MPMKISAAVSIKKSKPATIRFRKDGRLDYRARDERGWLHGLSELSHGQYLALPYRVRRRLVLAEFLTGKSLVSGSSPLVSRT
jgi:hypothetical protein